MIKSMRIIMMIMVTIRRIWDEGKGGMIMIKKRRIIIMIMVTISTTRDEKREGW